MGKLPCEKKIYFNLNILCTCSNSKNDKDLFYPPKFLSNLSFFGLLDHALTLGIGFPVLLLRNLN